MAGNARTSWSLDEKSPVPRAPTWGEPSAILPPRGRTPTAAFGLPDTFTHAVGAPPESVGKGAFWFVTQTAEMSCIGPFGSLLAFPILSNRVYLAVLRPKRKRGFSLSFPQSLGLEMPVAAATGRPAAHRPRPDNG